MLLMRTLLYVPVNRERFVESARTSQADVIVLDLEDSVPPAEKVAAREALLRAAPSLRAAGKSVHVRINALDTGLTRDDIAAAVAAGAEAIACPKIERAQDIRDIDVMMREQETRNSVRAGSVGLLPLVESAIGILRCEEIAGASTRLTGISLGAYDYVTDLGVERTTEGRELDFARRMIVHACVAHKIQPLDTVFADFRDEAGLIAETEFVKSIGFKGKYVIHPSQIGHANRIFGPREADVEKARKVVAAFDAGVAEGHASVQLDGEMIDTPVARRARDLIAFADAIAERAPAAS